MGQHFPRHFDAIHTGHEHGWWLSELPIRLLGEMYPQNFAEESHPLLERNWIVDRLMGLSQLGQIKHHSIGSFQTRSAHSLESAAIASAELTVLRDEDPETFEPLWDAIVIHALLHDGGHGPYSHAIEDLLAPLTGTDHKRRGLALLDVPGPDGKTVTEMLAAYGIDPDLVKTLMRGDHPASGVVADKTLGAEKIAYLISDREHHPRYARIPSPDIILSSVTYRDGIGLHTGTDQWFNRHAESVDTHQLALDIQQFYARMYAKHYFSPQSLLLTRHLQRATQALLDDGHDPNAIWDLVDVELENLARDGNEEARTEIDRLARHPFAQPRIAIVPTGHKRRFATETARHVPADTLSTYAPLRDPHRLHALEQRCRQEWKQRVYVTACPTPERFAPHPVRFFGSPGVAYTLADVVPDYDTPLRHIMLTDWAIRVHTDKALPPTAPDVFMEFLSDAIRD